MKLPSYCMHLPIIFLAFMLSGCPGGGSSGGNNNNSNNTPTNTFDEFIPITAVALDNQTGTLPAGSIVPLACVSGGSIIGPDACGGDHLHGTISISGIGSGFTDPAQPVCGHGQVGTTFMGLLTHRCDELDDAKLAIIVDDLTAFSNIFLTVIDGSDSKFLIGDIKSDLRVGLNPVSLSVGNTYVAGELMTRCDRGTNPDTGNVEVEHYKISLDYDINSQLQVKLPFCRPYADIVSGGVNIDLTNNSGAGGDFFTGRRGMPAIPLIDGSNNMLNFDVRNTESQKTGIVLSYTTPTFSGFAFSYNPLGNEDITADSSTLKPTIDVDLDDSSYQSDLEYKGIKAFGLGLGLSQNYASLDRNTPPRTLPSIQGLSSLGGIYKYKAEFEATEIPSGRLQGASIRKYYLDEIDVQYTEPKPPYITEGSLTLTDDPDVGFDLSMSYSLGSGYINFNVYKVGVRAEVLDNSGVTPTLHKWKVDNYRWGGTSNTDATWPSSYFSANGDTAPTVADITRLKYSATDNDAVIKRDLYRDRPYAEIDRSIGIGVDYKF